VNTIFALAGIVIKELYRRKDFYVLFVITAVITLMMASVNIFQQGNIVRYLKDICLLLIWVSSLAIAIGTAARQIPAERESRTIFPLLAKPVSRWQVVAGKFLGCWLACGIALLVFYFFFAVVSGAKEGSWPILQYFQAFWLQWAMLAVVVAMVLLGSVINGIGERCAGSDQLDVTFYGIGGHGSAPEMAKDPIVMACNAVMQYQTIISRNIAAQAASDRR
jgi:ABC-type transport system involved in multi-copper enzyme maturation permease subunit